MGLLGLYMGKVTWVRKKLVGSAVFLNLVRALVFSDPSCAENRVECRGYGVSITDMIVQKPQPVTRYLPTSFGTIVMLYYFENRDSSKIQDLQITLFQRLPE